MNATENTVSHQNDPYPFEDFAPTLSQCFFIVIVGYLMARFQIFSASEVKGVGAFATYFAMPGIICVTLADADFGDFGWELLVGIFLGKFLIFVLIIAIMLILKQNLGVAGLVALFCVQSNDLPVGNPLMSALYKDYRPHMTKYLFFIPAMTVIFFVPAGNILVQIHRSQRSEETMKYQQSSEETNYKNYLRKHVFKGENLKQFTGLIKNPVILSTTLGLILNFSFSRQLPKDLHQPIEVVAATIPGVALAILGFSMVRKERHLISSSIVVGAALLYVKMLFTPILLHVIMKIFTDDSPSSKLLSDFALLYGIISPATAIFQSGLEFRKSLAGMGAALILTSFTCFPVSYVIARNTIVTAQSLNSFLPLLKPVLFWTACLSIVCNVTSCIMILLKKQRREVPYCYVTYFAFTQIITSSGVLLWCICRGETWSTYCQMILYYGGEVSGYLWACILGFILVLKEKYMLQIRKAFALLSFMIFSISALITMAMCLLLPHKKIQGIYIVGRTRSRFEFQQLVMTTILLFLCVVILSVSLVLHFRKNKCRRVMKEFPVYENTVFYIEEQDESINRIEDLSNIKIHNKITEAEEATFYCENALENKEYEKVFILSKREWTFRFSSLILMVWLILLVRLIANLYKITRSKALEIMVPLEFFQSTFFIGQGLFILLTFGIDVRTFTVSFRKWWRKLRNGDDKISTIDPKRDVGAFCNKFYSFYYLQCFRDLAEERRWKGKTYRDSFWGHQLVDWLIGERLCVDDSEAEEIGQKLLTGGVIKHVTESHNFCDAPYLYFFPGKNWNPDRKEMPC